MQSAARGTRRWGRRQLAPPIYCAITVANQIDQAWCVGRAGLDRCARVHGAAAPADGLVYGLVLTRIGAQKLGRLKGGCQGRIAVSQSVGTVARNAMRYMPNACLGMGLSCVAEQGTPEADRMLDPLEGGRAGPLRYIYIYI